MKKRNFKIAAFIAAIFAFTIVSCSKQQVKDNIAAEPAAREKIETLAQRFTQLIGSDHASLKQQYAGLNEADLKIFWQAVYKINHQNEQDAGKEAAFLKMMDGMNTDSKNRFGVPFNKASAQQLSKVMNPETGRNSRMTPGGRVILPPPDPTSCEFLPYPLYFYNITTTPYSGPANACRTVDFYPGDCDGLELTYNGLYSILSPISPLGEIAVALFLRGDHINNNGTKTRVLHKKSSAENFFGSPGCTTINNHFRMSTAIAY